MWWVEGRDGGGGRVSLGELVSEKLKVCECECESVCVCGVGWGGGW